MEFNSINITLNYGDGHIKLPDITVMLQNIVGGNGIDRCIDEVDVDGLDEVGCGRKIFDCILFFECWGE